CPAFSEKDVGWRARSYQFWSTDGNIAFEGRDGFLAQRQDALFVAFSDNIDETGFEMKLFETDAAQFGEAQARSVGEFEDGLVAQGLRRLGVFRCEKLFDFLAAERFGQTFPTAWK